MATTSLAKKPASFMREFIGPSRDLAAALERARDKYVAALKRAEANYFDDVKKITDALHAATAASESEMETAAD